MIKSVKPGTATGLVRCACKHEQQDELYGTGWRVANAAKRGDSKTDVAWRCTVCGATHGDAKVSP